jgi:hypothetical protein
MFWKTCCLHLLFSCTSTCSGNSYMFNHFLHGNNYSKILTGQLPLLHCHIQEEEETITTSKRKNTDIFNYKFKLQNWKQQSRCQYKHYIKQMELKTHLIYRKATVQKTLLIHEFHCKNNYPKKGHSWHCARNRNVYTTVIQFGQNYYLFTVLSEFSSERIFNWLWHLQNYKYCYNKKNGKKIKKGGWWCTVQLIGILIVVTIIKVATLHFVNSCWRGQH